MVPDNEDDDRHRDFMWQYRLLNKEGLVVQFGETWVVCELEQEKGGMGTAWRRMMMPTNDTTFSHGVIIY
jgi:hypothetical protein